MRRAYKLATPNLKYGQLTQLGECLLDVEKVTGSSPVLPTKTHPVEPFRFDWVFFIKHAM